MSPVRSATRAIAALLAALAAVAALAACGAPAATTATANQNYVAGDAAVSVVPAGDRVAAPALRAATVGGGTLSLASLRGRVVVLNVWASWCPPCRAEAPGLQAVADQTAARGVSVVGLDSRDNTVAAQAFTAAHAITYPSLVDPNGLLVLQLTQLPPQAIPSTLVIDRAGRVAARIVGPVTEPILLGVLRPVIAEHA